ncbi:hypothetical protein Tco_0952038 [Tanacetum coccineum]|uniref:Uncharacterized protein n=1 Tax=Tanacetum coccineum TaxID=301880 RepID=A0ABQ5DXP3_9ASTR
MLFKGISSRLNIFPVFKSKKEIEQERLSFAEVIRLEEQMNEEQRAQWIWIKVIHNLRFQFSISVLIKITKRKKNYFNYTLGTTMQTSDQPNKGPSALSHNISIGLLFDDMTSISPLINFLIQTASIDASAAAMYSTSVEDITIVLYLALF